MKTSFILFFILVVFLTCPTNGQVVKRSLTEEDYKLWSTMEVEQLSNSGSWVSYSLHYESGKDTLFVKNTKNLKTYSFAGSNNGSFVSEHLFLCQDSNGQLIITSLASGKQHWERDVSSYSANINGSYLLIHRNNRDLIVKNLKTEQETNFPNVSLYSYNESADAFLCSSKNVLLMTSLKNGLKTEVVSGAAETSYSDFTWQGNGASFVYFFKTTTSKIGYYNLQERKVHVFDPIKFGDFPKDRALYNASFTPLTISDDGSKVFFGLKTVENEPITNGIQIWNTGDKLLYPAKRLLNNMKAVDQVGAWVVKDDRLILITDSDFPYAMISGDQQSTIVYNPQTNEPLLSSSAPIDFYLQDIDTGKRKLILEKQSRDQIKLTVSNTGKFIACFKEKNWWVYDLKEQKARNLTLKIGTSMEVEDFDRSGERPACGIAGWTDDDSALLLYDDFDIWIVKTDGSGFKRLTDGRKDGTQYRILPLTKLNRTVTNFSWSRTGVYNLNEGLYIKSTTNSGTGFSRWDMKTGIRSLVSTTNRLDYLVVSKDKSTIVYSNENFHQSPILFSMSVENKKSRLLFASNPQQKKYHWGFSKKIRFTNSKGDLLQGALYYPADYSPERSYPMVVKIYEKQSHYYSIYENPSVLNGDGFNATNFTLKGYFVLLPDIEYEQGNTGRSATDCVLSACKEVLAHENVDVKRIGLLGHSFGGYETNFIITQTDFFAAALAGAGVSDVISNYLSVFWLYGTTNYFRFESDQSRLGLSLFEDYERYTINSPITYAKNVTTPLLTWSGIDDRTVPYSQSLEFHLALRRMRKPNILLLYENESHSLSDKAHKIDLTNRVEEWFGYYLKGENKPEWFTPNKF